MYIPHFLYPIHLLIDDFLYVNYTSVKWFKKENMWKTSRESSSWNWGLVNSGRTVWQARLTGRTETLNLHEYLFLVSSYLPIAIWNPASALCPYPCPIAFFYQWSEEDIESRLGGKVGVLEGRNWIQKDFGSLDWGVKANQIKHNRNEFNSLYFHLDNQSYRNKIWNT